MTIKDLRSEHSSERVKITKVSIDLSIMLSSLDYVFSEMHKLEEVIPETELASCISSIGLSYGSRGKITSGQGLFKFAPSGSCNPNFLKYCPNSLDSQKSP